jgi:predicted nuclease of predicted toxin-antitoxin system
MNFLLDENFPKSAEELLVKSGHHVLDIRGSEFQGADDFELFEIAQSHSAVLLTTDRDFYHTVPLRHPTHFGVVVIALKQPNRRAILSRLQWVISQGWFENVQNTVVLLRDKTYRIHK